jgi:hypothetical protein
MSKFKLGIKIDWKKSFFIGLPVFIGYLGLSEVFAIFPGMSLIPLVPNSQAQVNLNNNQDEVQYFVTLASARAGNQTNQKDSNIQVGHSALIFEKIEIDPSSKLAKSNYFTMSPKGEQWHTFWKLQGDDPLLMKYKKAQSLDRNTFEGASFLRRNITKDQYLKYLPTSIGGKVDNYLGVGGCYFYTLLPTSASKSWFCNCATGTARVFGDLTGIRIENKYPTSVSQNIDRINNPNKNWFYGETGKFTPIHIK